MKKYVVAVLALFLFVPAFAKHTRTKGKKVVKSEIRSVTVRHTGCFGRCPDYKVEISNDGIATYTGTRYVADSGVFKKLIGVPVATRILKLVSTYRLDTCSNRYENRVPDLPGLFYTIKFRDSTKNIVSAEWGPSFLKAIADSIESVGKKTDKSWKKVK